VHRAGVNRFARRHRIQAGLRSSVIPHFGQSPRIYMAAERTFLAWVRTGLAFMGFGLVIARFGFFLRELAPAHLTTITRNGLSLPTGIGLIMAGVLINIYAALRHRRYIHALDKGHFRNAYTMTFTYAMTLFWCSWEWPPPFIWPLNLESGSEISAVLDLFGPNSATFVSKGRIHLAGRTKEHPD
jgi:putative membrane protein